MLENLHWEHPRRPHDFHSSREGAPNPWRSRREARCLDLTVELSAPPARGGAARRADPVHAAARKRTPTSGTGLLQAVLDGEKLEDTSGGVRRCVDVVPPGVLEEHRYRLSSSDIYIAQRPALIHPRTPRRPVQRTPASGRAS